MERGMVCVRAFTTSRVGVQCMPTSNGFFVAL
jgi:hypothetical protein